MAYSEILKVKPQLDSGDLGKMEKSLTSRFASISKKFGKGLLATLTGGGIAGVALGILDKLLNPMKEVQDAIDKSITLGNDLVTNAKQFDSSAGKLFKLTKLAQSTGLDQDTLFMMLTKFQTAVAETRANPQNPSAVRNFVDQKDTVEGFFDFIQGLQKMTDTAQRVLVQNAVFGERLAPKAYSFFQANFGQQQKKLKLDSSETYDAAAGKLSIFKDATDEFAAARDANDLVKKAVEINSSMIMQKKAADDRALNLENKRIQSYNDLAKLQVASDRIMELLDDGFRSVAKIATSSSSMNEFFAKLSLTKISSLFSRGSK